MAPDLPTPAPDCFIISPPADRGLVAPSTPGSRLVFEFRGAAWRPLAVTPRDATTTTRAVTAIAQSANHPPRAAGPVSAPVTSPETRLLRQQIARKAIEYGDECPICFEKFTDKTLTERGIAPCGHAIHDRHRRELRNPECPTCRQAWPA